MLGQVPLEDSRQGRVERVESSIELVEPTASSGCERHGLREERGVVVGAEIVKRLDRLLGTPTGGVGHELGVSTVLHLGVVPEREVSRALRGTKVAERARRNEGDEGVP